MRRMLTMLLAALFLFGGSASVVMAAQADDATPEAGGDAAGVADGATAFATGLNDDATYFAANGAEVALLRVTDVERDWQDYGEFYEPEPGIEYVAITFEVENISNRNITVGAYDFSLLDTLGMNNSTSFADAAEGADVELLSEDVTVASGDTVERTVIFELFEGTDLGYFLWQPDSGIILLVDLTGE